MTKLSKLVVVTSLLAAPALAMACGMEKTKSVEAAPAKPAVARVEKGEKAQAKAAEAAKAPTAAKPATAQN